MLSSEERFDCQKLNATACIDGRQSKHTTAALPTRQGTATQGKLAITMHDHALYQSHDHCIEKRHTAYQFAFNERRISMQLIYCIAHAFGQHSERQAEIHKGRKRL